MILDIEGRIMFDDAKQLYKILGQITKFNKKVLKSAFDGGISVSNPKDIRKWLERGNQQVKK